MLAFSADVSLAHTAPPPQSECTLQLRKQLPFIPSAVSGRAPVVVAPGGTSVGHPTGRADGAARVRFGAHHIKSDCTILPVAGFQTNESRISPSSSSRQLIGGRAVALSSGDP